MLGMNSEREDAMTAVFVVQGYTKRKGGLAMDAPVMARDVEHARRTAERLAQRKALVVAFVREGDPATGDWEDAKLIAAHGAVPAEIEEMPKVG